MVYESSYESGLKPFRPDATRGHWAAPSDFLYACWGLAFKMDIFSMSWYFFFEMGIFAVIPYFICMGLYVVPILLIQSFLGQFSSSGFISAFRISPLFKGMGYISLALNFSILTYYSVFAAIPLIYFVHALRPTMPWSCESFLEWSKDAPNEGEINLCTNKTMSTKTTTTLSPNSSEMELTNETLSDYEYHSYQIPSVMFFRSLFSNYSFGGSNDDIEFAFSWQLLLSMMAVWAIMALIFYKIVNVGQMGKWLRYTNWLLVILLLICISRLVFLTDAIEALEAYFLPNRADFSMGLASIPIFAVTSFGTGWGSIVSLASFNKFRTNIMSYSWFICLGQMVILILFGLTTFLIDRHFTHITNFSYYSAMEQHWVLYLSSASAMVNMELANMWSLLFYSLLIISALLIMVTQLFALLTAVFDDFEFLRPRKQEVTFGLIGMLACCSIYFCSNHGLSYFTALPADALVTQTGLNLLLLLVVLWVYGRVRFQRDIEFMLGQRFATWRVYVLRFLAPLGLLITLLMAFVIAFYEHYYSSIVVGILAIFLIGIPWLFIPGYAVLSICQTSGTIGMRLKRCCRPTDWYPVDPEERQRYEEAMGNMDITHQLNEVGVEDVM